MCPSSLSGGDLGKHGEGGRGRSKARKGCVGKQFPPWILGSVLLGLWGTVWNKPESCPSEGQGCWAISTLAPLQSVGEGCPGALKLLVFPACLELRASSLGVGGRNQRKLSGRETRSLELEQVQGLRMGLVSAEGIR